MTRRWKWCLGIWSFLVLCGFVVLKLLQIETLLWLWGIILILSGLLFLTETRSARFFSSITGQPALDAYAMEDLEQREKLLRNQRDGLNDCNAKILLMLLMPIVCLLLDYFVL